MWGSGGGGEPPVPCGFAGGGRVLPAEGATALQLRGGRAKAPTPLPLQGLRPGPGGSVQRLLMMGTAPLSTPGRHRETKSVPAVPLRPWEGSVVEQPRKKHWAAQVLGCSFSWGWAPCSPMTLPQQLSPSHVDKDRCVSGRASLLRWPLMGDYRDLTHSLCLEMFWQGWRVLRGKRWQRALWSLDRCGWLC